MKKVILDTSFLMVPFQFKTDIITELERILPYPYQLLIIDKTVDELNSIIEKQSGNHAQAAKFALKILEKENIGVIDSPKTETYKNVDKLILNLVNKEDYLVATQDKALKTKLREKKVKIIELRQKNYLIMD